MNCYALFGIPVRYVTMLREPVARVVSLYKYLMAHTNSPAWFKPPHSNLSLEEFVTGGFSRHACNGQVRFLTGQLDAESVSYGLFETALRNIDESFISVGITERFDESLMLFRENLAWRSHCCYLNKKKR